jgi:hypothetical protein
MIDNFCKTNSRGEQAYWRLTPRVIHTDNHLEMILDDAKKYCSFDLYDTEFDSKIVDYWQENFHRQYFSTAFSGSFYFLINDIDKVSVSKSDADALIKNVEYWIRRYDRDEGAYQKAVSYLTTRRRGVRRG